MSCRSTTIPRNQLTSAMPIASTKSTTAVTHATGLRTTGPHPLPTFRALVLKCTDNLTVTLKYVSGQPARY